MSESFENQILVFTNQYPYGSGETFFKDELEALASGYDRIYIQPLVSDKIKRDVPENVVVFEPIFSILSKKEMIRGGLFSCINRGKLWKIFGKNFIQNVGQYLIARKIFSSPGLRKILETDIPKYFYWGRGAASLTVFYNIQGKKIVRLHGFDLYENDIRSGNVIPLREELVKVTDSFIFVSDHGRRYFHEKYKKNGTVFYLGVHDNGLNPSLKDKHFVLLSCSSIIPLKRVNQIAEALHSIKSNIHWIHIGDGPDMAMVKNKVGDLPSNIKCTLTGALTHGEVLQFFRNNHIDFFINFSETEGLPVSMMEALSFGVPLIGTDVGGVSEIISPSTGVLLASDANPKDLNSALLNIINLPEADLANLRLGARVKFESTFEANSNYQKLIQHLKEL